VYMRSIVTQVINTQEGCFYNLSNYHMMR